MNTDYPAAFRTSHPFFFASDEMPYAEFSNILTTQDFDLRLSSPRQPGHGFRSRVNARQSRQFIPQEAISFVEIADVFVDLFDVMS
jgi:hypothetical protein